MRFIADLVDLGFKLFEVLILARVLLSWINADPYNQIVKFIYNTTEPILAPIRRTTEPILAPIRWRLPPSLSNLDFSPMIVLLIAIVLNTIIIRLLYSL